MPRRTMTILLKSTVIILLIYASFMISFISFFSIFSMVQDGGVRLDIFPYCTAVATMICIIIHIGIPQKYKTKKVKKAESTMVAEWFLKTITILLKSAFTLVLISSSFLISFMTLISVFSMSQHPDYKRIFMYDIFPYSIAVVTMIFTVKYIWTPRKHKAEKVNGPETTSPGV